MCSKVVEYIYLDAVSALKSPVKSPKLIKLAHETIGVAIRALNTPGSRDKRAMKIHTRLRNEIRINNVVTDIGNRVAAMLEDVEEAQRLDGSKILCRDKRSALMVDNLPGSGALISFEIDSEVLKDTPYMVQNEQSVANTITGGFSLSSWRRREYPDTLHSIARAILCRGGIPHL